MKIVSSEDPSLELTDWQLIRRFGVLGTFRLLVLAYLLPKTPAKSKLFPKDAEFPPRNAEFLLKLIRTRNHESLEGDLLEDFAAIAADPRQGFRRARFWYWCQVLRSFGSTFKVVSGIAILAKYWEPAVEFIKQHWPR